MPAAVSAELTGFPSSTANRRRSLPPALLLRFALVPVAVGICYLFSWSWLRALTADANVALDRLAGVDWTRLSSDTVSWRGITYQYVVACTFADVFFGAVSLVWDLQRKLLWNLAYLAQLALGLFAFNVFRLSVSDVIFAWGVPWSLAHNVVSGFAYFAVWVWLWQKHSPKWFDAQVRAASSQ